MGRQGELEGDRRGRDAKPARGTGLVPDSRKGFRVPFPRTSRNMGAGMGPTGDTGQLRSPEILSATAAKPGPDFGTRRLI